MTKPATPISRDDSAAPNFIADRIDDDLLNGKNGGKLQTRFPPEPNGFLHIGHAKAIFLNYEMAKKVNGGSYNLRLDDTNPVAEDDAFVSAIKADVKWLGCDPGSNIYFASDYFDQLYAFAQSLVRKGLAYVDSQTGEEIRENRGNFYQVGKNSAFRDRSIEENLELLEQMRIGDIEEGSAVLRAKIDMAHKNLNLRDPLLYRIRKVEHHRTGRAWSIYPMYDFAHPLSDAIEGITHSLCTLEFESHRPLYNWMVTSVGEFEIAPEQIEFARLNITYTVLSKRKLQELVQNKHVNSWDDPRMPTIAGMRRRGYLPESLSAFCERIGVAKRDSLVDVSLLEHRIRDDLNQEVDRTMAVVNPLKVVIENMTEQDAFEIEMQRHPEFTDRGTRTIRFEKEIFIERDDFMQEPIKKWFRLAPGREVRLRGACLIQFKDAIYNDSGELVELRCTWDPESKGGMPKDGRKVKGTLHWISKGDAVPAEMRLYDRLFTEENPLGHDEKPHLEFLNPASLITVKGYVHQELAQAPPLSRVQFERIGYYCVDQDSSPAAPILNRTITLKDSWSKLAKKK